MTTDYENQRPTNSVRNTMYKTHDYPKQGNMAIAVLSCIAELGGRIRFSFQGEMLEAKLADYYKLTEEQRSRTDAGCKAKGKRVWRNHIQYVRNKMIDDGLLDGNERDVWRITLVGYEQLSKYTHFKTEPLNASVPSGKKMALIIGDEESLFPEGKERYRMHKELERDQRIVQLAKQQRLSETGYLKCDICAFDFFEKYGVVGEGFIEAHHITPVSELDGTTKTRITDLALVCCNCHRMLHRRRPWLSINSLRELIDK